MVPSPCKSGSLLEQVVGAHPLARGRIAVRLLPGDPGHDQDLLPRLQHEPRIDDAQHGAALALLPGDDLQAGGAHRRGAGVLQHEPFAVELLLVGGGVRFAKLECHGQTSRISASFLAVISSTFGDGLVGGLLHALQALALVVLGDRRVLERFLQHLVGVAARAAQGDLALLGHLLDDLDQLLAPLLGQRRHRQAHQLAVGLRVQAQLRRADRLLDLGDQRTLPGLDGDEARVGDRDDATWFSGVGVP